jgi:hypothetical protein
MVSDMVNLASTLENLARTTWTDIADGRRLGIGMGEVGITDRNMLALRREHPSLLVRKHTVYEEVQTGADWEWWIGTSEGWMCFVFQAKMLNINGRYPGITKGQAEGKAQVDLLLRSCLRRSKRLGGSVWPLYCFYNNWEGTWPEGVRRFDRIDPCNMSNMELQLYGCAASSAWNVRQVLVDLRYSNRRTLRDSYLPASQPWSTIFSDSAESTAYSPGQTMMLLSSLIPGHSRLLPVPPSTDKGEAVLSQYRRDSLAVYRDPELIDRPPDYVLDVLEGTVKARRLKPLARRVVILPGSD